MNKLLSIIKTYINVRYITEDWRVSKQEVLRGLATNDGGLKCRWGWYCHTRWRLSRVCRCCILCTFRTCSASLRRTSRGGCPCRRNVGPDRPCTASVRRRSSCVRRGSPSELHCTLLPCKARIRRSPAWRRGRPMWRRSGATPGSTSCSGRSSGLRPSRGPPRA